MNLNQIVALALAELAKLSPSLFKNFRIGFLSTGVALLIILHEEYMLFTCVIKVVILDSQFTIFLHSLLNRCLKLHKALVLITYSAS